MKFPRFLCLMAAFPLSAPLANAAPLDFALAPKIQTEAVPDDADDPAIWVHPTDPAQSVIVGTNKNAAPGGGLYVFGLDGKIKQSIQGLDRPNNVDIETGFLLGARKIDIAVTTERNRRCLRVFAIENGRLRDIAPAGLPVFEGQSGESGAPMGIALYKRPRDGAIFAVVSRKTGSATGYLWQYRLSADEKGVIKAEKVRQLGDFSGKGEIESVAVDDELGAIYYSDEGAGYRKWAADPDDPRAAKQIGILGIDSETDIFGGDREGIAVAGGLTDGFLVVSEQIKIAKGTGGTIYRFYHRAGSAQKPDEQSELVAKLRGGADDTDGLEATTQSLGPDFPRGALVVMNSVGRNFWIYDWRDIERELARGTQAVAAVTTPVVPVVPIPAPARPIAAAL